MYERHGCAQQERWSEEVSRDRLVLVTPPCGVAPFPADGTTHRPASVYQRTYLEQDREIWCCGVASAALEMRRPEGCSAPRCGSQLSKTQPSDTGERYSVGPAEKGKS